MSQLIPIIPRINNHSYEWSDIILSIAGGTPVMGITEINYGYTRKAQNIYGAGSEPVTVGYSQKEYTASISIKMEEAEALVSASPAPFGMPDVTMIPRFAITISWIDSENALVTEVMENCTFLSYDKKTKAGDTSTDMTFNILFAGLTRL